MLWKFRRIIFSGASTKSPAPQHPTSSTGTMTACRRKTGIWPTKSSAFSKREADSARRNGESKMPFDESSVENAIAEAEQFIKDRKITALPIDPVRIAKDLEIEVVAKPASSKGVSGMLLRYGDDYAIAYATHIDSDGFQRFSIAHELGHYLLPGHI